MTFRRFTTCFALTIVASGMAFAAPDTSAAERASKEGRWSEALVMWRQAGAVAPDDVSIVAETGWAEMKTGNASDARRSFLRGIRLQPGHMRALVGLSALALAQRNTDEALRYARQATDANKRSVDAFRALGDALMAASNRSEAEVAFRTAVQLDPNDARSQYALAATLRVRGKLEEALVACRAAARLDPTSMTYRETLAFVAMSAGHYGEAAMAFSDAIDLARMTGPQWSKIDALGVTLLDCLGRVTSGYRKGAQTRTDVYDANIKVLQLSDAFASLPELKDSDPSMNPANAQRAHAFDLLGQACAGELASLKKDSQEDSSASVLYREQARRALVSARAAK